MNQRGMTLVELMIVVAIIGILAAIGSFAYGKYMRTAKTEKLRAYATEIASGQERYRARNNVYWGVDGVKDYSVAADKERFVNLLDFSKTVLPSITIETIAWTGDDGDCGTLCAGAPSDTDVAGYAVRVSQDLQPGGPETTIVVTHATTNPILLNEGE